jgi:hypothetical protein
MQNLFTRKTPPILDLLKERLVITIDGRIGVPLSIIQGISVTLFSGESPETYPSVYVSEIIAISKESIKHLGYSDNPLPEVFSKRDYETHLENFMRGLDLRVRMYSDSIKEDTTSVRNLGALRRSIYSVVASEGDVRPALITELMIHKYWDYFTKEEDPFAIIHKVKKIYRYINSPTLKHLYTHEGQYFETLDYYKILGSIANTNLDYGVHSILEDLGNLLIRVENLEHSNSHLLINSLSLTKDIVKTMVTDVTPELKSSNTWE